jgi:predicted N-acyltransferase
MSWPCRQENWQWSITHVIKETDKTSWNRLAAGNPFLQTTYLQAMEEASLPGFSYRYVLLRKEDRPLAAIYFQLADLTSKMAGSIINIRQKGSIMPSAFNAINKYLMGGSQYKGNYLLTCGNMSITGDHGIACQSEHLGMVMDQLPQIINEITLDVEQQGGRVLAVLVKDFYQEQTEAASVLKKDNFLSFHMDPNMIVTIPGVWTCFEDYLRAMSAKYRLRAKKTRALIQNVKIKELDETDLYNHAEAIERLYSQVWNRSPVLIVQANISFFLSMKKHLKNHYRVYGFFKDDRMIAFTTGYYYDRLNAHFIGMDYTQNQKLQLYLNILYDFIERGILYRHRQVIFGRTAIEIKSTTGAQPYTSEAFLKIKSGMLHRLASHLLPLISRKKYIIRNPFRQSED